MRAEAPEGLVLLPLDFAGMQPACKIYKPKLCNPYLQISLPTNIEDTIDLSKLFLESCKKCPDEMGLKLGELSFVFDNSSVSMHFMDLMLLRCFGCSRTEVPMQTNERLSETLGFLKPR